MNDSQQKSVSNLPPEPVEGVSSVMHDKYGRALRLLFEHLFGPLVYPASSADQIRDLAQVGVVVYTTRVRSTWLALYFNFTLSRLGLPLAKFVGGINLWLWQPIDLVWKAIWQKTLKIGNPWNPITHPSLRERMLASNILAGESAFIFLTDRRERGRLRKAKTPDYLRALIIAQRLLSRPIFLIPHAVTNTAQGGVHRDSLRDRLFGIRRYSSRRRALPLPIIGVTRRTTVRVCEPINIALFIKQFPTDDDEMLARRLRHATEHKIREEERIIAGPEMPSPKVLQRHVLRNPSLVDAIAIEAKAINKSTASVEKRAKRYLREIAARYTPWVASIFARIMRWIFTRIYDGVVIDETGLRRVFDLARNGPIVFCPSHRSHVDYLVLSTMLWLQGFTPPHIAAGANLSFFPLGNLFRNGGAFFLRRSFKDNRLYSAVFRAYLAELIHRGTALEFFIEGTRSRTGKVLMPRMGLLSIVVGAWRSCVRDDVLFVPVSIDYERIIEAGSYERELKGAEKKPEDISSVIKTTRVLRSRYGQVHLQFGEPISLKNVAQTRQLPQSPNPEYDEQWRSETERLGFRILHHVATVSSVTPTAIAAMVLLGHSGRGLAHSTLMRRALELIDYLETALARLSAALLDTNTRQSAIVGALSNLVEQGTVTVEYAGRTDQEPIYRVVEEQRITLDYFKNALMNYVAPAALIARSLCRHQSQTTAYAAVKADVQFLSRLFKREFLYRADSDFSTYFDEMLAALAVCGFLDVVDDNQVMIRDADTVALFSGLLDSFVEAYWITTDTAGDLKRFPLWHKELATRALERARRAFLEGQIKRPEAASRTLIDNSLDWMLAEGFIEVDTTSKRRPLRLATRAEPDGLDFLVNKIKEFV